MAEPPRSCEGAGFLGESGHFQSAHTHLMNTQQPPKPSFPSIASTEEMLNYISQAHFEIQVGGVAGRYSYRLTVPVGDGAITVDRRYYEPTASSAPLPADPENRMYEHPREVFESRYECYMDACRVIAQLREL